MPPVPSSSCQLSDYSSAFQAVCINDTEICAHEEEEREGKVSTDMGKKSRKKESKRNRKVSEIKIKKYTHFLSLCINTYF